MRLQKQVNRVVDDKEYAKYVVIIPPEDVQQLGWDDGEELEHEVKDETLLLRKLKPQGTEATRIASKYARAKRR